MDEVKHQHRVSVDDQLYIVDIYLPKWKIAVEVDEHHNGVQKILDKIRETILVKS